MATLTTKALRLATALAATAPSHNARAQDGIAPVSCIEVALFKGDGAISEISDLLGTPVHLPEAVKHRIRQNGPQILPVTIQDNSYRVNETENTCEIPLS